MNINSLNSSFNIYSLKQVNSKISFCGNLKAEDLIISIQDFISGKSNKKPYLDNNDGRTIYEYFGYEEDKNRRNGDHRCYVGPYNQTASIVTNRPDRKALTADIVRGIKNLDKLDNELFIFDHEPSEEEIAKKLEIIRTKKPVEGRINKYAQKIAQKDTNTDSDKSDIDKKELYDTIDQQRLAIIEADVAIEEYIQKINSVKDDYEYVKKELNIRDYKDKDGLLAKSESLISETEELIAKVQKSISKYNSMFQNNEALSDEQLKNLYSDEMTIEQNIDSLEIKVDRLATTLLEFEDFLKEARYFYEECKKYKAAIEDREKEFAKLVDKDTYGNPFAVITMQTANKMQEISNSLIEYNKDFEAGNITIEEIKRLYIEKSKLAIEIMHTTLEDIDSLINIKTKINSAYNELIQAFSDFSVKLENCEEKFNKNAYLVSKRETIQICQTSIADAKKTLSKVEKKIKEGLKKPATTIEDYQNQLRTIQHNLDKINASSKEFEKTIKLIDKEFIISDEEFEEYKKQRAEKMSKKFSQPEQTSSDSSSEEPSKEQISSDKTSTEEINAKESLVKEEVSEELPNKETLTEEIEEVFSAILPVITNKPIETKEELREKIKEQALDTDLEADKKIRKKSENDRITRFSNGLAKKIAPLEFDETIQVLSNLISIYVKSADITQYSNNPNASLIFSNKIINKVVQSSEGQRIKNATRFAFLKSLYDASETKNGQIYTINYDATKEALKQYKNGLSEISVISDNNTISTTIEKDINISDINLLIKSYNLPMKHSAKTDKVIDVIFEFLPSKDETLLNRAKEFLMTQGSYYELLADDSCPFELNKILVETFLSDFDKTSSTNLAEKARENYAKKEQELKKVQVQQEKIEIFESVPWTIFD